MKKKKRAPISEAKCPWCGKKFVPAPYHVYKHSTRLYCSWTCLSQFRKVKEASRAIRGHRGDVERFKAVAEMHKSGMNVADIARKYDLCYSVARRLVEKGYEVLNEEMERE